MELINEILQTILSGIAIGCIYGLVALGFVLIFKATEVINFAQGEMMTIGAFITYTLITLWGFPYWAALLITTVSLGLFGMLLERTILRPLIGEPVFAIVMLTIGLGYFVRAFVSMVPGWGADTYGFRTPFSDKTVAFGALILSWEHLAVILMTLALIIILFAFFRFSRIGVAMRATSQNQLGAVYMGISVNRVFSLTWTISAALGGGRRDPLGTHDLRSHEYGVHWSQGLPSSRTWRFREHPGGNGRGPHYRRYRELVGRLSTHRLERRSRMDHSHRCPYNQARRTFWHSGEEKGLGICAF